MQEPIAFLSASNEQSKLDIKTGFSLPISISLPIGILRPVARF